MGNAPWWVSSPAHVGQGSIALAHDPEFGFAHGACGIALRFEGQMARGADALSKALALNDRESSLLQAVRAMAAVQFDEADSLLESHLRRWPRDALALMLHGSILNIFSSRPDRDVQLLRTVEACLPAFEGHPYVLGQFALALEENRRFTEAHTVAVEAVREVPNNARAAHAAAHTYFETGQLLECEEFIESWIRRWENAGPFTCHLVWHRALSAFTRGDIANTKRGLVGILAFKGKSLAVLSDAASLAWRLRLDGEDVGAVWDELEPLPDVVGNRFGNAHPLPPGTRCRCARRRRASAIVGRVGSLRPVETSEDFADLQAGERASAGSLDGAEPDTVPTVTQPGVV